MIVIILGLLAYTLYENNSLQNQVNLLQKENNDLELNLQVLGLRVSELVSLFTTTASAPSYKFEVTSVCVSTGRNCPLGLGGGTYVYSFGVKNTGKGSIPASADVFMEFVDTSVPASFAFNATLPSSVPPNSTAYLQAADWPAGTNAATKLSPGDSVAVTIYIGNVQGGIDTAVLTCSSATTTEVNGTSTTTQTYSCG